ncbi:competence protein CoiA family protein [Motiliproteus sp.]|uniref:competence protein CoiA family protein n=1 Tax=Motiliproteus sp. TaxID=1898955 RepID=UPI003BAA90EC
MCRDEEIDLSLGIKNGALVFIDEVERGLDCGCCCPHCGGRLIAKKGEVNQHHFAHYQVENCGAGLETALHLLGKEILQTEGCLQLPGKTKASSLADIELERRRFGYVADVGATLKATGEEIDIEIKVTHGVDERKVAKVVTNKALMAEIDLSGLLKLGSINRETVTAAVLWDAPRMWVDEIEDSLLIQRDEEMANKHLVCGFKSASGYSRKNQRNFEFSVLYVLVEVSDRSSPNYQIHGAGGFEKIENIPMVFSGALAEKLEQIEFPVWAEVCLETHLIKGRPKALVSDVIL